jgi:hypothetical protein
MLPGFLVCLLVTGVIGWLFWCWLPGPLFKLAFFGLGGLVWLVQGARWAYRYFGYNYRLTTRRLLCHLGFTYHADDEMERARMASIHVRRAWKDRLLGVGQVLVLGDDPGRGPLVLEGVCKPARVAEEIRVHVQRAREQASGAEAGTS